MDVEELTVGVADLNLVQSPRKKRKLKRTNRGCPNLGQMPVEVLETIFLVLDPQTVCAATAVSRRFAYIGSSRFWMKLLSNYWYSLADIEEPVSTRLALSKTLPTPQIHFVSFRNYALGVQGVAVYAESLCASDTIPFEGSKYLGLTLPHGPVRNALARFYPDRQFYLAAYGASSRLFNFGAIVLSQPKEEASGRRHKVHRTHSRDKARAAPLRHFFPIGLKPANEQERFLDNFKNAKAPTTTDAMLLSQAISSLLVATHTKGSLGRISVRIPGLNSLPPPKDIEHFFVRSTINIAKIPSLALEFAYDGGVLVDLIMHSPSEPWRFRD